MGPDYLNMLTTMQQIQVQLGLLDPDPTDPQLIGLLDPDP
jgi:hypothetical protein